MPIFSDYFFKRIIVFAKFTNYYANYSTKLVKRNQKLHNPDSPLLINNVKDSDVVKEISEHSCIDFQQKLF